MFGIFARGSLRSSPGSWMLQVEGCIDFLAVAFEEVERGDEEASCGEGEEDDGVAIGSLGCGWGGGGVVEALGAALRVGCVRG